MFIHQCYRIRGDLPGFAKNRLRLFFNGDFTAAAIIKLHNLGRKDRSNAKRQALEMRHCLLQAEEYLQSAKAASLATRPVLIYYAIMSFALAEILYKGTGMDRLAKLRENHDAHGLSLIATGRLDKTIDFREIASNLIAKPQSRSNGNFFGTFARWADVTRESPVPIKFTEYKGAGTSISYRTWLAGQDRSVVNWTRMAHGCSLLDALRALPQLGQILAFGAIEPSFVGIRFAGEIGHPQRPETRLSMAVQPAPQTLHDTLYSRVLMAPAWVNSIDAFEMSSGHIFHITLDENSRGSFLSMPPSITLEEEETYFLIDDFGLGEFGSLYVALHIAGNFARYYPDLWVPHVESSSLLAATIDELCNVASARLPIIMASEFDRIYYFGES